MDISAIRKDYTLKSLDVNEVNTDPVAQFNAWFQEAVAAEVLEVNAMTLSTIGLDGVPNARIVLLKELDHGFVFFTNYESEKGQEIHRSNLGAITFFWPELERQVRIRGEIEKVSSQESDKYFFSRPYSSQIGAWASPQSKVLIAREDLNLKQIEMEQKFSSEPMQRPVHWGGYRLLPSSIEFWQGRPSRLHDRVKYTLNDKVWEISRLAP